MISHAVAFRGEQGSDFRRAEEGCPERLGADVIGDVPDDLAGLLLGVSFASR